MFVGIPFQLSIHSSRWLDQLLNFKTFSFDCDLPGLISGLEIFFTDVKNAFILHGPKHEWICATEAEDDKFLWLSVLQSAIKSSMEKWENIMDANSPWQRWCILCSRRYSRKRNDDLSWMMGEWTRMTHKVPPNF